MPGTLATAPRRDPAAATASRVGPKAVVVFSLLMLLKGLSRVLFRFEHEWIGDTKDDEDPWRDACVGAVLNHTSLFEPVFVGVLPPSVLWRLATVGAIPIADVTMARPIVGRFFRLIAAQVITVSRKRDATWKSVLSTVRPDSLIVLMPEGRMMRPGGLDKSGRPMTVRGGIADIVGALPVGRLVLGYSGGLHHVQAPGQRFPRLFRTVRIRTESLDISAYRESLLAEAGQRGFKRAVVRDLERRRDANCPWTPETTVRDSRAPDDT